MARKKKNRYYTHLEPICVCMRCNKEHLRRQRRKIVSKEEPQFLSISVCPNCGKEGYVLVGDKEVRRKIKE